MIPTSDSEQGATVNETTIRDLMPTVTRPLHLSVGQTARSQQTLADAPPITPRRRQPRAGAKWRRRLVLLALAVTATASAAWYREPLTKTVRSYVAPSTAINLANIQTYTVKRGELRITMVEEGKLRAVNTFPIRMGVNGKITWLAEAGSKVKKGDKLAVIDTKQYEDNKKSMETSLNSQLQALDNAETQIPIAEADGKAAIANARNALKTAELALKQYISVDVPKKLNDFDTAANDARIKLADQIKKRADLQQQLDEMLNEGTEKTAKQNEVNVAKQTEASLRRTVTTAEDGRKLFRSHSYKQDLGTKQRAVANAELDVTKAEVKARNDLLAKKSDVLRLRNQVTQYQNQIKQYDDSIAKGTAVSPTDGLVFYGGPDLERYGLSADQIKVGADWYSNYPIMSIPDLSSFQVAVPIAEVYRGRVNVGMPATVLIDAVPGLVLSGKLNSVSSVSRPKYQSDSSSPPVYDAVLAMDSADPRMVAGMTVRVEIVTATLADVMYVPVEAIFNEEGQTAAFVWVEGETATEGHLEKRPVLTGQSNDHFVEIKKGLKESERLALSRPASYVTPTNYRELADATFPPPSTAPAKKTSPSSAPAAVPASVMRDDGAAPSTRPATTRPVARGAVRPATAPDESIEAVRTIAIPGSTETPARRGGRGAAMPSN